MTRIDDIKACQRIIGTTPDGDFGKKSEDALIGYFRAKGLLDTTKTGHMWVEGDAEYRTSCAYCGAVDSPKTPGTCPGRMRTEPAELRRRIVATALREVCALPSDNADPDKYWSAVCPELVKSGKAWCGGFALWCYKQVVPACKDWTWKSGVGFVFRYGMRIVSLPEPGDLVYWEYLNGRKIDHYAIVKDVKDGIVYSIDGNQGISPRERVEERDRSIVHTKPVFFSIGAFL